MSRQGANAGVNQIVRDWTRPDVNTALWLEFPTFEMHYRLFWEASHLMCEWFGLINELNGIDVTGPLNVLSTPLDFGPVENGLVLTGDPVITVPGFTSFSSEWVPASAVFGSTGGIMLECWAGGVGATTYLFTNIRYEVSVKGS